MNKARTTIDWIALVFSSCVFLWSVTSFDVLNNNHQVNREQNLFEMSIEELMEIEVASTSKEKNNIPKTSWIKEPFRHRV